MLRELQIRIDNVDLETVCSNFNFFLNQPGKSINFRYVKVSPRILCILIHMYFDINPPDQGRHRWVITRSFVKTT